MEDWENDIYFGKIFGVGDGANFENRLGREGSLREVLRDIIEIFVGIGVEERLIAENPMAGFGDINGEDVVFGFVQILHDLEGGDDGDFVFGGAGTVKDGDVESGHGIYFNIWVIK